MRTSDVESIEHIQRSFQCARALLEDHSLSDRAGRTDALEQQALGRNGHFVWRRSTARRISTSLSERVRQQVRVRRGRGRNGHAHAGAHVRRSTDEAHRAVAEQRGRRARHHQRFAITQTGSGESFLVLSGIERLVAGAGGNHIGRIREELQELLHVDNHAALLA